MAGPLSDDFAAAGLDRFAQPAVAATAVVLQAAALLDRPNFALRVSRAGLTCRDGSRSTAHLALGDTALRLERFLHGLALTQNPDLAAGGTLTDSIRVLRTAGLLPLTEAELNRWSDDERAVSASVDESKARGRARTQHFAAAWDRRAQALFADPRGRRELPRYFAMLELQTVRNAHAHGQTQTARDIDAPWTSWCRWLGFIALVSARAFAHGVLSPPPHPDGASATAVAAAPLIASSEPLEPPAPSRARRWFLITTAATVAVVVGTILANVVAPRSVQTAADSAGNRQVDLPALGLPDSRAPSALAAAQSGGMMGPESDPAGPAPLGADGIARPASSHFLNCTEATGALVELLQLPERDVLARIEAWSLMPPGASSADVLCSPSPVLWNTDDARLVAAALARHAAPPIDHDGTWRSWTLLGTAAARNQLPAVPAAELARHAMAEQLAVGVHANVPTPRRRKTCARWTRPLAERLGDPSLLTHILGTEPGRECAAWLADGALRARLAPDVVADALARGLGPTGQWRNDALARAEADVAKVPRLKAVRAVLRRLP